MSLDVFRCHDISRYIQIYPDISRYIQIYPDPPAAYPKCVLSFQPLPLRPLPFSPFGLSPVAVGTRSEGRIEQLPSMSTPLAPGAPSRPSRMGCQWDANGCHERYKTYSISYLICMDLGILDAKNDQKH